MMPVRDVQRRHIGERVLERALVVAGDRPESVLNAIGGREVEERRSHDRALHDPGHGGRRPVSQEHRPRLRTDRQHVARAVVFLVASRVFVLLDSSGFVLIHREARGNAGLFVPTHAQPVDVQGRGVLDDERRGLPQAAKVAHSGVVDGVAVRISSRRQIDFRARDVKKAEGVVAGEGGRLRRAHHIVGNGRDVLCGSRRRAKRAKGKEPRHPSNYTCRFRLVCGGLLDALNSEDGERSSTSPRWTG